MWDVHVNNDNLVIVWMRITVWTSTVRVSKIFLSILWQDLTLWAYPKTPGFFEDAVVCCIRENPEPVIFKISCHGVRPELELDRRQLQFDRVLLHRFVRWISLTATVAIWKTFCYLWEGQKYLLFIHFNAPIMREKNTRERVKINQKGPRIIKNGGRLRWINEEPT